jgi:coenzyme F420-0:L-glutamate ligase / coenzyme F420-1:gamma-L-glutamate ligase
VGDIRVIALTGIPEVRPGDDLVGVLGEAIERVGGAEESDILVVAHKIVSKAERRVEQAEDVMEVVLREARAVRRRRGDLVIAETEHGFVCASAGVDRSNAPGAGWVVLLPRDPDASARRIRAALTERLGIDLAVVVSDSFGRAWRQGTVDVAVGVAGLRPLLDLRGTKDTRGYELESTQIAVATPRPPATAARAIWSCLRSATSSRRREAYARGTIHVERATARTWPSAA